MIIDSRKYSGPCSCGRSHSMTTRTAIIEKGALTQLEDYMLQYAISGKRCALYGKNSYRATEGRHPFAEQEIILDPDGLHANEKSTAQVLSEMENDIEVILAIGSGTIHDIARFCANERKIRFVSVPTGASVDGFCSTVAAMTWYGYKKTMPAVAPEIVIADTEIIRDAPPALVRSGVGDIIAKYIALAEWRMANIVTGEYLCEEIFRITKEAADTVVASIPGILAGDTDAFASVTYALVMSGIAMQMMGNSRPASGAEHHISHLIEMNPEGLVVRFSAMHGEKTGVGSVLAAREYNRLAQMEDLHGRVLPYKPLDEESLAFFGKDLRDGVVAENETDCLEKVQPQVLEEKWSQLRAVIAEMPSAAELDSALAQLGAKRTLEEIGVAEEDLHTVLRYSAMIRNRLTLMRMRRMIDET